MFRLLRAQSNILPESREQLVAHITRRAPIGSEELKRRLESMENELGYAALCNRRVKNAEGKLEETLKNVEECIIG